MDAESLALCAEGLLSRRRSERVRSHVASCPECAAAQARLTEIPGLLASVPPPSLPPGIAARLDAAVSAEAARRAGPESGAAEAHPAPARHPGPVPGRRAAGTRAGGPHGPRFRVPARVLAAAAGILVVAGGVGYAVSQASSPPASPGSSGSEAAPASGATAGPQFRSPAGGNAPGAGQGGSAGFTVSQSGTRYGKTTFAAQAAAVLSLPSAGLNHPAKGTGGLSLRPTALTPCVDKVAGRAAVRAGAVRLVDQARYRGHPATVIVVQATPAQPGTVYVAGGRCSATEADILAHAPLPAAG
jgi:hypothetical protein